VNRDTATELAEDTKDLLALVDGTVKAVQGSVISVQKTLDEWQSATLELDHFKDSDLFGQLVAELNTCVPHCVEVTRMKRVDTDV
jgi:hypothetical protein